MARGRPPKIKIEEAKPEGSYWDQLNKEVSSNQSKLSMVLGALIILVVGILVFNYFSRNRPNLGPAQKTEQLEQEDVSPDKLPGKYKVKEGDTLFLIAEKYYKDGYKFTEIVKANNLQNPDLIDNGQLLEIPKLVETSESPTPSETPQATVSPIESPAASPQVSAPDPSTTPWGTKITDNTYTVVEGDWLSKIAGRAYGNIFAYKRIAQVNNIKNPNLIYPGQTINIPR